MLPDCEGSEDEIQASVVKTVREVVGPVAAFRQIVIVPKLPKTRSGKVARSSISSMAAGKPYK
ncbi:acyl-CoA synthetase short-chain family member 3, partial [Elysia marginata]